jgi:hypothetical protein
MTTEIAISEEAISEESNEVLVPVNFTFLLERRPVMIYGNSAYRAEMGEDFSGALVTTLLERTGWAVVPDGKGGAALDPTVVKILREIWPVFRAPVNTFISIYAGYQPISTEDAIIWQGPFPFIVGVSSCVQPLVEGAFLALRFTSIGQHPWALLSVDLDIDVTGEVYTQS